MRASPWVVSSALAFVFSLVGTALGGDPPAGAPESPAAGPEAPATLPSAEGPSPVPGGFECRLFDVGAWVGGMPSFGAEKGPFPTPADQVNDEACPLFGNEGGEDSFPYGSIDDVIERVKALDPRAWGSEGVSIEAVGHRWILVRGPAALDAKVAEALADLERRALVSATIDVLVLRGEASSAADGGLAAAVARGELVPLAGARSVGFASQRVVGRSGADRTYVQDEDVEVAEKAQVPDPIVGVAKEGLAFEADLQLVGPDRAAVRVHAWWGAIGDLRRVNMQPSGDPVERIETDGRSVDASLDLVPGAWTVLPSTGAVSFAVRATVRAHDTPIPARRSLGTTAAVATTGPLGSHFLDVRDFARLARNARGRTIALVPSNYTPPEPPALAEPQSPFPSDALLNLVRLTTDAPYWESEGAALNLAGGDLHVRADEAHTKAVADRLDALRGELGRATRLRATVVSLPLASIPEYLAGLDDGATLLLDGGKSVLARAGATIVDRGGVRCRPSQRSVSVGGNEVVYVADYDVEIAQASTIGNPITQAVLNGLSFDATCRPAAGGAAVACDLRVDRSTWKATRDVRTQHGDIECPTIGISRLRGSTVVPLGTLRIVGATLENGVVTLTILSANPD